MFIFFFKKRACIEFKSFFFFKSRSVYMKQCLARDDRETEKKGMFKVETFWLFNFFFIFFSFGILIVLYGSPFSVAPKR